jgi:hypothetical protein
VVLGQRDTSVGSKQASASGSASTYPVALVGRVPVKISTSSASIAIGDYITSSSEPGLGMKATKAGMVVGRALEPWSCEDSSSLCRDSLEVFVEVKYFLGPLTSDGYLDTGGKFAVNDLKLADSENIFGRLFDVFKNQELADIATNSGEIDTTASLEGTLTDEFSLSQALGALLTRIEIVEADVTLLQNQELLGSLTASGGGTLISDQSVLGATVISPTLDVGIMSFNGLVGSINALGPLQIQPLALGDVEFLGGMITIDQKGNLNIKEGVFVANEKVRNSVTLPAGFNEVEIDNNWEVAPLTITATADYDTYVWVENISEEGFKLKVKNISQDNQTIYWQAIW